MSDFGFLPPDLCRLARTVSVKQDSGIESLPLSNAVLCPREARCLTFTMWLALYRLPKRQHRPSLGRPPPTSAGLPDRNAGRGATLTRPPASVQLLLFIVLVSFRPRGHWNAPPERQRRKSCDLSLRPGAPATAGREWRQHLSFSTCGARPRSSCMWVSCVLLQAACLAPASPAVGNSLCPWSPGLGCGIGVTEGRRGREGRSLGRRAVIRQAPCSTLWANRGPLTAHVRRRSLGGCSSHCQGPFPAPQPVGAHGRHADTTAFPGPPEPGRWFGGRTEVRPLGHLASAGLAPCTLVHVSLGPGLGTESHVLLTPRCLCRERDRRAGPRGHDADRLPGDGHQDPAHQERVGPALPPGAAAEPHQQPLRGPTRSPGGSPCGQRHPRVAAVAPGPAGTEWDPRRLGAGHECFLQPSWWRLIQDPPHDQVHGHRKGAAPSPRLPPHRLGGPWIWTRGV